MPRQLHDQQSEVSSEIAFSPHQPEYPINLLILAILISTKPYVLLTLAVPDFYRFLEYSPKRPFHISSRHLLADRLPWDSTESP